MQPFSDVRKTFGRELNLGWRQLRHWAERVFAKQRITEIAIVTSTLTIIGLVLLYLARAIQRCTITGPLPY